VLIKQRVITIKAIPAGEGTYKIAPPLDQRLEAKRTQTRISTDLSAEKDLSSRDDDMDENVIGEDVFGEDDAGEDNAEADA
jgi:hypothetical protein